MTEQFKGVKGCTGCCPGGHFADGTEGPGLYLMVSLADVERISEHLGMGESELIRKYIIWVYYPVKNSEYVLLPTLKTPCPFLKKGGCSLHNLDCKPLMCRTQPESYLVDDDLGEYDPKLFPCLEGKKINQEERGECEKKYFKLKDEIKKTMQIIPFKTVNSGRKGKPYPLEDQVILDEILKVLSNQEDSYAKK
jgi:Fe-S-cluster containining protein